jgi:hypothetical protein
MQINLLDYSSLYLVNQLLDSAIDHHFPLVGPIAMIKIFGVWEY